jgi:hypothetical protein
MMLSMTHINSPDDEPTYTLHHHNWLGLDPTFLHCQKNSSPMGQVGMTYCTPQMCRTSALVLKYAVTSPYSS